MALAIGNDDDVDGKIEKFYVNGFHRLSSESAGRYKRQA